MRQRSGSGSPWRSWPVAAVAASVVVERADPAVRHVERFEDLVVEGRGEGLVGELLDRVLEHLVAATRVAPGGARLDDHGDRIRVGGRRAGEHLVEGREWLAGRVADERHRADPGGVGEQTAWRHAGGVDAIGPRRDRSVEVEPALVGQAQHQRGGQRLGDRGTLEAGRRRHRILGAGGQDAPRLGEAQLAVVDHRQRHPRHAVMLHPLAQRPAVCGRVVAGQAHGRHELLLDLDGLELGAGVRRWRHTRRRVAAPTRQGDR